MIHEMLPVGVLQCNCSIFGDEQTRQAIVIDPGDNIPEIQEILKRHGLTVKAIVITHAHIDHIGGAHKLRAATGAAVYMNPNDTMTRRGLLGRVVIEAEHVGLTDVDGQDHDRGEGAGGAEGADLLDVVEQVAAAVGELCAGTADVLQFAEALHHGK